MNIDRTQKLFVFACYDQFVYYKWSLYYYIYNELFGELFRSRRQKSALRENNVQDTKKLWYKVKIKKTIFKLKFKIYTFKLFNVNYG